MITLFIAFTAYILLWFFTAILIPLRIEKQLGTVLLVLAIVIAGGNYFIDNTDSFRMLLGLQLALAVRGVQLLTRKQDKTPEQRAVEERAAKALERRRQFKVVK